MQITPNSLMDHALVATDFRDNGVQMLRGKSYQKQKKKFKKLQPKNTKVKRKLISNTNTREGRKPIPTRFYWLYK